MKYSTKALLWSGLVFPGLGHLYLRRWIRGLVLASAAAGALWLIVSVALTTALELAAEIQRGTTVADPAAISALVEQRMASANAVTRWPTVMVIGLWLVGMADAWRLGRARDRAAARAASADAP
ncbi:MAG: hypothetical protein AB7Q81_20085 [Gammaproteobacteria bacterium]